MESNLIKHLRSFNRKERFHLLRAALGADTFTLDDDFRERLSKPLGVAVPPDAFVAMDYHLDWLQTALVHAGTPELPKTAPKPAGFAGTQIDVDLLVAFDGDETTHLVLIEAKMETGWSNKQACKKAEQLRTIFSDPPDTALSHPHYVLLSPTRPQRLRTERWPSWMHRDGKPRWMPLDRPDDLLKVTRSDANGTPSARGECISIHP